MFENGILFLAFVIAVTVALLGAIGFRLNIRRYKNRNRNLWRIIDGKTEQIELLIKDNKQLADGILMVQEENIDKLGLIIVRSIKAGRKQEWLDMLDRVEDVNRQTELGNKTLKDWIEKLDKEVSHEN